MALQNQRGGKTFFDLTSFSSSCCKKKKDKHWDFFLCFQAQTWKELFFSSTRHAVFGYSSISFLLTKTNKWTTEGLTTKVQLRCPGTKNTCPNDTLKKKAPIPAFCTNTRKILWRRNHFFTTILNKYFEVTTNFWEHY